MNQVSTRTTETIAAEINTIKNQTQNLILQASAEIGKRLIEAKEQLQHGEWGNWLQQNVEYSQSTANNLMKIYKEYNLDSQTFGNLSYSKAVALLSLDTEEREAFVTENNVDDMSMRELQTTIKEKKELEKQLKKEQKEKGDLEKGIKKLEKEIELARQKVKDENNDEIQSLQVQLEEMQKKTEHFEKALREKPIEAKVTVEENNGQNKELTNQVQKLQEQLSEQTEKHNRTTEEVKFEVLFNQWSEHYALLTDQLEVIEDNEKYKNALLQLLEKMKGHL